MRIISTSQLTRNAARAFNPLAAFVAYGFLAWAMMGSAAHADKLEGRCAGLPVPISIESVAGWESKIRAGLNEVSASPALLSRLRIDDVRVRKVFFHRLRNESGSSLSIDIKDGSLTSAIYMSLCDSDGCLSREVGYSRAYAHCMIKYEALTVLYTSALRNVTANLPGRYTSTRLLSGPNSTAWYESFLESSPIK